MLARERMRLEKTGLQLSNQIKSNQDVRTAVGGVLGTRRAAAGLHGHLAGRSVGPQRRATKDHDDGEGVPPPRRRVYQSSRRKMVSESSHGHTFMVHNLCVSHVSPAIRLLGFCALLALGTVLGEARACVFGACMYQGCCGLAVGRTHT